MNEPKLSEILHEIQLAEIHKQVVRVAAGLRVLMILTEKEWEGSGHSSVAWLKGCLAMPCREDMLMPKIQEKMAGKSLGFILTDCLSTMGSFLAETSRALKMGRSEETENPSESTATLN